MLSNFRLFTKNVSEFIKDSIKKLENYNDNNILEGLGELVTPEQKIFIKNNLKKDTITQLNLLLQI